FYFSFAFFPLLLFLVTLFGMVLESTDELRGQLYQYLAQIMPGSAYTLVQTTMDEIIESSSGGKLTLGALVTLWSASAGIDSLRIALNRVYEVKETRAWWKTKLQSLVLTFLFILLLAIGLAAVTAGWTLVKAALTGMGLEVSSPWIVTAIQWSAIIIVMVFSTAVVYSWLPNFKTFNWVWISPGAITAISVWIIFGSIFRVYLQYFNSYNKAYGSLGAVIILMLWMYITGLALLTGGVMNSVLTELSEKHVIDAEDPVNPA
ncbi:MAG TPA: YihY/virulence factor BrkB family protein, partial [Pyrinomonadaceae bacterium]|nr:YihY/virulence factor BrkB family protein [Pyrinomonadaceae bacterium]